MPDRRTFAAPVLGFAHSMLPALRHPACACQQRRLPGHGHPLPAFCPTTPDVEEPAGIQKSHVAAACLRRRTDPGRL